MSSELPKQHPRYQSLYTRSLLEQGVERGITTLTGLVSHGRGEAFDYLLGEQSHEFAREAARAAAALMCISEKSVISVNGNTAMLVRDEMAALSQASGAIIEINLFHDEPSRRAAIASHFRAVGVEVLGVSPDATIPGLSSPRARVDSKGMLLADVVLVSLEDGDRTEALLAGGKKVIAIDLNPLSRTPQKANISIIDNVSRAIPLIQECYSQLKGLPKEELQSILDTYSNPKILKSAEEAIRKGFIGG